MEIEKEKWEETPKTNDATEEKLLFYQDTKIKWIIYESSIRRSFCLSYLFFFMFLSYSSFCLALALEFTESCRISSSSSPSPPEMLPGHCHARLSPLLFFHSSARAKDWTDATVNRMNRASSLFHLLICYAAASDGGWFAQTAKRRTLDTKGKYFPTGKSKFNIVILRRVFAGGWNSTNTNDDCQSCSSALPFFVHFLLLFTDKHVIMF